MFRELVARNVDKVTGTVIHSKKAGVVKLSFAPPSRQRMFPERSLCVGVEESNPWPVRNRQLVYTCMKFSVCSVVDVCVLKYVIY
jgi:hypothetical protein